MTRSGDLGRDAENGIVRYLRANGFPYAERRRLMGQHDQGDITGTPGLVWQSKGGAAAHDPTPDKVAKWWQATRLQTVAAGADYGVLVCKRSGYGESRAGQWWAYLDLHTVLELTGCLGPRVHDNLPNPVVRMTLADATHLLRHAGYGDSLEESA